MKRLLISFMMMAVSASAFANVQLQCDQVTPTSSGFHERFIVELNDLKQLISVNNLNWNDLSNTQAGGGDISYADTKPLSPQISAEQMTYTYVTAEAAEKDLTDSKTTVMLTLTDTLSGPATAMVLHNNGASGVDSFELNCR